MFHIPFKSDISAIQGHSSANHAKNNIHLNDPIIGIDFYHAYTVNIDASVYTAIYLLHISDYDNNHSLRFISLSHLSRVFLRIIDDYYHINIRSLYYQKMQV